MVGRKKVTWDVYFPNILKRNESDHSFVPPYSLSVIKSRARLPKLPALSISLHMISLNVSLHLSLRIYFYSHSCFLPFILPN